MTFRPPARIHDASPGDSQLRLVELIRATLPEAAGGEALLMAQSGASPVAKAVIASAAALRAANATVRILFTREDESLADFVTGDHGPLGGVMREVRVSRNPRLRDAHEQLVIAAALAWHGDSMRRDLHRRDVMHQVTRGPGDAIRQAVRSFELMWVRSEPVFSCIFRTEPATATGLLPPLDTLQAGGPHSARPRA